MRKNCLRGPIPAEDEGGAWWANAQAPLRMQSIRINKIRRMRRRNKAAMWKLNHKSQGEL
jgi:hypothetical protein